MQKVDEQTKKFALIGLILFILINPVLRKINSPEMVELKAQSKLSSSVLKGPRDDLKSLPILVKSIDEDYIHLKEPDELTPLEVKKLDWALYPYRNEVYSRNWREVHETRRIIGKYVLESKHLDNVDFDKKEIEKFFNENRELIEYYYNKEYKSTLASTYKRYIRLLVLLSIAFFVYFINIIGAENQAYFGTIVIINFALYFFITKLPTPLYMENMNLALSYLGLLLLFYWKEKIQKNQQ